MTTRARGEKGEQGEVGPRGATGSFGSSDDRDQFVRRQREASVDHDLLIKIEVKLDNLTSEMSQLKIGMAQVEAASVKKSEFATATAPLINDHETRIRRLELWGALGIGGLTVTQIVLQLFKVALK